ncbi:MAG: pseudouridine synthase [Phycisphaerales bacterium]|nr:rRNA pseudouridine synthase [Phycisphaerales bacterium]
MKQKTSDSPRTGGDGQVRLHKALATAGLASRRACEELIARGAVAVNGEAVVRSPVWVNPDLDKVTIDGRPVRLKSDRLVYVMLYKPRNTVTTLEDPDGRRTVGELVDHPSGERLYPVGRLDYDTMGLVLMTNDGELANRLTHPRYEVHKTYRAVVKGRLEDEMLEKLREGFYLADRRSGRTDGASKTAGAVIEVVRREPTRTLIDITLREGRNRQVRRMLAKVGCPVKKLVRIQMGPLTLKGVPLGAWRELTSTEVGLLKRAAGIGKGSTARSKQADEGRGGQGGARRRTK